MNGKPGDLRKQTLKGFFWYGAGTSVGQAISWLSTIIIIRLLSPEDYGLMAMTTIFITLLSMLTYMGIDAAIVQAEIISDSEIREVSGWVIICSVIGYLFAYFTAPWVARFYGEEQLVVLTRVIGLNFLLTGVFLVPQARLVREMDYQTTAKIEALSQVGGAGAALVLALAGAGVWALVVGSVGTNLIKAIGFLLGRTGWIFPRFAYRGIARLLAFGMSVMGSKFLYYLYLEMDKMIVGKVLGEYILGLYSVALNLAAIPLEKVLPIVTQVTFSSYSRIQNDLDRIGRNVLLSVHVVSVAAFPLFWGMAAVAPEAIPLLLGTKWVNIIVPFQLLCLILPLKAVGTLFPSAVLAIGKSKVNFVNMAITCTVMGTAFLIGVSWGLVGVCIATVVAYPIVFLITSFRNVRELGLPFRGFLSEIWFPSMASGLMTGLIFLIRDRVVEVPPLPGLILFVFFGIAFYLTMVFVFRRDDALKLKGLLQRSVG